MIGLCLGLAGVVWVQLPVKDFTLAWTHTVEKIRWEEDYHLDADGLQLGEARIQGNGAGMQIPDGAVLRDGFWHYRQAMPPLQPLRLGRAAMAGDYQLCYAGGCHALAEWLGPPGAGPAALELWSCQQPAG